MLNVLPDSADRAAIQEAREQIAYIGRMLFDRKLTDAAGGNLSVRVGDWLCMSPTKAGQARQWQLHAEDVLVCDLQRKIWVGQGGLTREANVHFGLHQAYGEYGRAVIHAHPQNLMVFAVMNQAMPPVQEGTLKFGITPVTEYTPAHSTLLGKRIVDSMRGREALIKKHAAATLAAWHGVFTMGTVLYDVFDAVERLDNNAYFLLMSGAYRASHHMQDELTAFEVARQHAGEDEA
jgi:L-fuculose-phosphate aldolase